MSDQPKPTGEWTAEGLKNAFDQIGCKNLADELNAALAAAKKVTLLERDEAYLELHQQLADERENTALAKQMAQIESKRANEAGQKVQTLVDKLAEATSFMDTGMGRSQILINECNALISKSKGK